MTLRDKQHKLAQRLRNSGYSVKKDKDTGYYTVTAQEKKWTFEIVEAETALLVGVDVQAVVICTKFGNTDELIVSYKTKKGITQKIASAFPLQNNK